MKTYRVRDKSGQTFEVDEDKVGQAEKDGFLPIVSNGKEEHRVSFNDLPIAAKDGYAPLGAEKSKLESAARGIAQGASFGFADEITGALESTFSDKTYEQARDESRRQYNQAQKDNPLTYGASEIGTGIATAFVPGLGALNVGRGARLAEVAGKAALQGGLTGAGQSEGKDFGDVAGDTIKGAALGGALGTAAHGVGKGIEKGVEIYGNIGGKEGLKNAGKAFKEGTKEESVLNFAPDWTAIPFFNRMKNGGMKAFKEMSETGKLNEEMKDTVSALQKTFGPGTATNLSDNDILMQKLLEQGIADEPNAAHRLVASKFSQVHGGSADQYLSLLKRSPEELAAAQKFNPIHAGEELAPQFDEAYKTLRSETGNRYRALSDEARNQFQKVDATPIGELNTILKTIEDDTTVSATSKNYIREGLKRLGDDFADLEPAEQFDRLVAAKDKLKGGSKWAARNEVPEGASAVRDASHAVDKYLKALDARKTADAEWTSLSRLDDNLFKKIGAVKNGKVQSIDPIKLEKIFSGSSTGRQLMKEVAKAEEVLAQGKLPPDKVESIQKVINTIKEYADRSSLSRDMSRFRYGDAGPSSPAIQRAAAVAGKDSATTTAVRAPQLFLKIKAAASDAAQSMYGKPFSKLNPDETKTVAEYALWISQNEGASDIEIKRAIQSFKDPKFKP